ncbi:MAG: DUF4861 domain-containing protein [candidate division KSB1 bacterium]|nr:DUF4861 domain-containing protein [candidate division KSB1 bacterium]
MKWSKNIGMLMSLGIMCFCAGCAKQDSILTRMYPFAFKVMVSNPAELNRFEEPVVISVSDIQEINSQFNPFSFVVLAEQGGTFNKVPSQAVDSKGNGKKDQIQFMVQLSPKAQKTYTIRFSSDTKKEPDYLTRSYAELSVKKGGYFKDNKYIGGSFHSIDSLRVPAQHTDHSFYIRYEGPGWESDLVGYRFYLDWRNAIDIFGKKTTNMVLDQVGQDGFDSYHEMSDWGMDILKVGESLGIGSLGMWHHNRAERLSETDSVICIIQEDGPIYSRIQTCYYGWQIDQDEFDVKSNLSISAGSRMTWHQVDIQGNPVNLCTGLVKHENASMVQQDSSGEWGYLFTFGQQSLSHDHLGMAVVFPNNQFLKFDTDEHNHVVVLKPEKGQLQYGFLAAWEQDQDGFQTKTEFETYLKQVCEQLSNPLIVEIQ